MGKFLNKVTTFLLALTLIVTSGIFNATPAKAAIKYTTTSESIDKRIYDGDKLFYGAKKPAPIYDANGNRVLKHSDFVLGELYTMADHTWMAITDYADENYVILQGIDFGYSRWPGFELGQTPGSGSGSDVSVVGDISWFNKDLTDTYNKIASIEKVSDMKYTSSFDHSIAYFKGLYLPGTVATTPVKNEYAGLAAKKAMEYCAGLENNEDYMYYYNLYTAPYIKKNPNTSIYYYAWTFISNVPIYYQNTKNSNLRMNPNEEHAYFALAPCFNVDTTKLEFQESTDISIEVNKEYLDSLPKVSKFYSKFGQSTAGIYAGWEEYELYKLFDVKYIDGTNANEYAEYTVTVDSDLYCKFNHSFLCTNDNSNEQTVTFTFTTDKNNGPKTQIVKSIEITILPDIRIRGGQYTSGIFFNNMDYYKNMIQPIYSNEKVFIKDYVIYTTESYKRGVTYRIPSETLDCSIASNIGTITEDGYYIAPQVNKKTPVTVTFTHKPSGLTAERNLMIYPEKQNNTKNSIESVTYNKTSENSDCEVYTSIASMFMVTIPKKIVLDGKTKSANYAVNVTGDIAGNELVNVVPDGSFTLTEKGGKADKIAVVTQGKTAFAYDDIYVEGGHTENGSVAAPITAGTWSGTFDFNIYLNDK